LAAPLPFPTPTLVPPLPSMAFWTAVRALRFARAIASRFSLASWLTFLVLGAALGALAAGLATAERVALGLAGAQVDLAVPFPPLVTFVWATCNQHHTGGAQAIRRPFRTPLHGLSTEVHDVSP